MDFQVQLHKIEQALCKDETEALAFLCRDIIDTDLSKMVSASHLFTKLKKMDLLEEEDYFIVAELLYRIRQFYLIKKMGKSKEQVEKELPQKGRISNYSREKNRYQTACRILETYTMNREKRGYCLIINNYDFSESRTRSSLEQKWCTDRRGTDADASALNTVFQWLGFDTVCLKDLTKKKILDEIEKYQNITDHKDRDCFVCCILSHGEKGKIYGTDGRAVLINEITKPFSGINCRFLIGKPKVFFIQACQGNEKQSGVPIEADGYTSELEEDDLVPDSIPEDADFLVGMATIEDYVSYRDTSKGTWYIQSLCQNLLQLVPRKEDLLTILTKVNMDVSQKTDKRRLNKQIPQPAFSFRKKLVFPVPAEHPPALLQLLESSICLLLLFRDVIKAQKFQSCDLFRVQILIDFVKHAKIHGVRLPVTQILVCKAKNLY
ncbi:UNVERIFIED_CONTAM: hypothetical protein FKN15_059632 [Acipenser sinensis]